MVEKQFSSMAEKLPPEEKRRRNAERCRALYARKKGEYSERMKAWRDSHAEEVKIKNAVKYQENKVVLDAKNRAYAIKNKERVSKYKQEWKRKRVAESPEFHLIVNMRERIRFAMTKAATIRCERTKGLLGCSIPFLRGYIEAKFEIGMTWGNYGQWHIDHIIPCAGFDLRDEGAQRECFNYSNLQPLWGKENLSKGDTMPNGVRARTLNIYSN